MSMCIECEQHLFSICHSIHLSCYFVGKCLSYIHNDIGGNYTKFETKMIQFAFLVNYYMVIIL